MFLRDPQALKLALDHDGRVHQDVHCQQLSQQQHIRDAVAICDWAAFMENQDQDAAIWNEISAMEFLSEFRLELAALTETASG